jgi:1,4-dihydroxy-2-naphthoyl-CoA hydrolase
MFLWHKAYTLADLRQMEPGTMMQHIGIELMELGPDFLSGRMPVDARTKQPAGLLHGGASVTLAETLGSLAAYLVIDPERKSCVGLDINANHLRSVREGWVFGTARPLHLGNRTQVWSIEIKDELGRLICISRITMAILDRIESGTNI